MRSNDITCIGISKYLSNALKTGNKDLYFAIGIGEEEWDEGTLPTPEPSRIRLYKEVYRQKVDTSSLQFVEPGDLSTLSLTPTKVIRFTIDIDPSNYYGVVREQGLFGLDADNTLDSGTLIEYSNFDKITIEKDQKIKIYSYISL